MEHPTSRLETDEMPPGIRELLSAVYAIRRRAILKARSGFSLLELIVALTIFAVVVSIAALGLRNLEDPLGNATHQLEGILKQARAKAMATTSAYRVRPAGTTSGGNQLLAVERSLRCGSSSWQADGSFASLELPKQVSLPLTSWSVCFSSRGAADNNLVVTLEHDGQNRQVEIYLAGGVTSR